MRHGLSRCGSRTAGSVRTALEDLGGGQLRSDCALRTRVSLRWGFAENVVRSWASMQHAGKVPVQMGGATVSE